MNMLKSKKKKEKEEALTKLPSLTQNDSANNNHIP